MKHNNYIYLFFLLLLGQNVFAETIEYNGGKELIGKHLYILEDKTGNLSFEDIINNPAFRKSSNDVPNFNLTKSTFWVKFCITNTSKDSVLLIETAYPLLDTCELYILDKNTYSRVLVSNNSYFNNRVFNYPNPIFSTTLKNVETKSYYLRINGLEQMLIPVIIGNKESITAEMLT